jgi:cell division protease FtsH
MKHFWQRLRPRQRHYVGGLISILTVAFLLGLAVSFDQRDRKPPPPPSFTALLGSVAGHKVRSLVVNPGRLTVKVTEQAGRAAKVKGHAPTSAPGRTYTVGYPGQTGNEQLLRAAHEADVPVRSLPLPDTGGATLFSRVLSFLPTAVVILLVIFYLRSMRPRASNHAKTKTNVAFGDVAGCGEAIEELGDIREFLSDPGRFEELGARVPKGVLLYGPPGTGKTMLAKAVAHEAKVPFFDVSGSQFVEMFAGLGATRIRSLFRQAKRSAPAIIFIDELDAVGRARSSGGDGGTREADQTLTQLLTEMDGFQVSEHPVIVIAASNHIDSMDNALLRPGRFDRRIAIDPPDRAGRRAILEVHARGKRLGNEVNLDGLAEHTAGMTGAELANILNETVLEAARRRAGEASELDLENAFFRVVAGAKKHNRMLSEHERRVVAYHESGHAIVGEWFSGADRVHKISIIPRGRSGGQTLLVSEEDVFLYAHSALTDRLAWLLAGRAAEQLVFSEVTTGAADDLVRATDLASNMVNRFGMSDSLRLRVSDEQHPLASQLQLQADEEVSEILTTQFSRALTLLTEQRATLDRVAQALLAEEVLDRKRFLELVAGALPGAPRNAGAADVIAPRPLGAGLDDMSQAAGPKPLA